MERYANGKIYKLVNNTDDEIYIGSTCDSLARCRWTHKGMAKLKGDEKVYNHLNQIGWDDVKIILIESFPCGNRTELKKRERYWFDRMIPSLNSRKPSKSDEERKIMSEKRKMYKKIYRTQDYTCDLCQTTCKITVKQRHIETKKHQKLQKEREKQKESQEKEVEIKE